MSLSGDAMAACHSSSLPSLAPPPQPNTQVPGLYMHCSFWAKRSRAALRPRLSTKRQTGGVGSERVSEWLSALLAHAC